MELSKHIILLLLLTSSIVGYSQKQSEKLKQREKELQEKIENTKNLLEATSTSKKNTLAELNLINSQINYREELVANINYQLTKLGGQILEKERQINSLENNLVELKKEYAEMLQYAFKNRHVDYSLVYIFTAKTYSEAYHRLNYLQQYAELRKKQVERIKATQLLINIRLEELRDQKIEQELLAKAQEAEKLKFLADKNLQQETLNKIKHDEKKLKQELELAEKKKREIERAIRDAIKRELELEAKKNNTPSGKFALTPEAKALSTNFSNNKGKLPWPVAKGEITGKYGKHEHEFVKNTQIDNNGIDITTENGAEIRAVFGGKVSSVIVIPGAGKAVLINHGAYRTVYSNLKDVYVKKGDEVKTKEEIGRLLPSEDGNFSKAHFEIWKIDESGMNTQNPETWIYR